MGQPHWPAVPAPLMGAQRTPFPVSAPHRVRPDLHKLEAGAPPGDDAPAGLLRSDRNAPRYLREKRSRLHDQARPLLLVAPGAGERECANALHAAAQALARAHPELIRDCGAGTGDRAGRGLDFQASGIGLRDDGEGELRAIAWRDDARELVQRIAPLSPARRVLAALSLSLQEDLALMANTAQGFVAEALSVAFASGWDPPRKIGRALFEIHAPVAQGESLRAASGQLARAMVHKGPFVRYVWTIADSGALDRPAAQRVRAASPDSLWFRCERQVTVPLPAHDRSLFLIRVFVAPLQEAASDARRRALLVSALASMGHDVLRYKGLESVRDLLLGAWAAQ
ncbi:MAG TPA: heme-dependent oxidative N-demethylase subunit alpha family protein [Burkholderiaceae bacterium]